jgi:hypothetical protein
MQTLSLSKNTSSTLINPNVDLSRLSEARSIANLQKTHGVFDCALTSATVDTVRGLVQF